MSRGDLPLVEGLEQVAVPSVAELVLLPLLLLVHPGPFGRDQVLLGVVPHFVKLHRHPLPLEAVKLLVLQLKVVFVQLHLAAGGLLVLLLLLVVRNSLLVDLPHLQLALLLLPLLVFELILDFLHVALRPLVLDGSLAHLVLSLPLLLGLELSSEFVLLLLLPSLGFFEGHLVHLHIVLGNLVPVVLFLDLHAVDGAQLAD